MSKRNQQSLAQYPGWPAGAVVRVGRLLARSYARTRAHRRSGRRPRLPTDCPGCCGPCGCAGCDDDGSEGHQAGGRRVPGRSVHEHDGEGLQGGGREVRRADRHGEHQRRPGERDGADPDLHRAEYLGHCDFADQRSGFDPEPARGGYKKGMAIAIANTALKDTSFTTGSYTSDNTQNGLLVGQMRRSSSRRT